MLQEGYQQPAPQQAAPVTAAAVPVMTAVQVTLPAGVVAGQMMQVTNPNTGTAMQFPVPVSLSVILAATGTSIAQQPYQASSRGPHRTRTTN